VLDIVLDAEAGQVSTELIRLGVPRDRLVHVKVEFADAPDLPVGAMAHAGGAFDWLADEPDLYTDADLIEPAE
jgi:hypothetical protein